MSRTRLGCYVVAWADARPANPPRPDDAAVVYVGMTHGRTVSLGNRVGQFGDSAGLAGTPQDGHYAALDLREKLPVLTKVQDGALCAEDRSRLFFALCPEPVALHGERERRDLRGVLPALWEAQMLWEHVQANRHLPKLNSSGSHGGAEWQGWANDSASKLPAELMSGLLSGPPQQRYEAAAGLLRHLACDVLGYSPAPTLSYSNGPDKRGSQWVERRVGRRTLCVGWTVDGRGFVSLWNDEGSVFGAGQDETAVADVQALRGLVARLLVRWP